MRAQVQTLVAEAGEAQALRVTRDNLRGDLERAYSDYRSASGGDLSAESQARADNLRRRLVQRYTVSARSAFAKQDLDGAIRHWDRVMQLDPSNDTARLEQQKALALKEKIKSLK